MKHLMRNLLLGSLSSLFFFAQIQAGEDPLLKSVRSRSYSSHSSHGHSLNAWSIIVKLAQSSLVGPPGPQGPVGPVGPQGPAGSLSASYASAWSATALPVPIGTTAIPFDNNQLVPVGIVHPVLGDNSLFQLANSGVYLIGWTIGANHVVGEVGMTLDLTLFNVSTGTPIAPSPFETRTVTFNVVEDIPISGQTLVSLPAGTILQLQATANMPEYTLTNRTFFITQVAP